MRTLARLLLCGAAALALAPAEAAETTLRIALVLPSSETDVAAGAALAADASNDVKAAGGKRPAVEIVTFNAGDASIAALAIEKAAKEKFAGVVAAVPENVAADMELVARRAKLPLVHVGPGGPMRTLDPADPVFRVDPSPADYGLHVAELLRLRSGRASVGLPAETRNAVALFPGTRSRFELVWSSANDNNVSGGTARMGGVSSDSGGHVDIEVAEARKLGPDRLVVFGCAADMRGVAAALDKAAWDVPILALDTALDSAPWKRKVAFVAAVPSWADEKHVDEVVAKHPSKSGPLMPATVRGFVATSALIEASLNAGKRGVVAALRDLHAGGGATEAPLFDGTGCVDRWHWSTWATVGGAAAPIKATFLPDAALGPLLGGTAWKRYFPWFDSHPPGPASAGLVGDTVVRVGFGGGDVPRTVDDDLATIGIAKSAGPAYDLALDQILARTCGKLSRVWSKNYDGSQRPALSFKIAFVPETAPAAPPNWDAVIAGDGPDGLHGGQSFLKTHRAQALSAYLLRNAKPLHDAKLDPPLAASDLVYLDGSYAWNTSADDNTRSDKIRALLDGVASTYCMKLSKQVGELAGLDVDHSGDPRSVMVAKGGEGTSDEFAYFPPAFAKVLEKSLGRVGAEGK